jgi:peptidoglycan/xylan/chitin deacetylase (PgdA/CDA1 family)
MRPSLGTFLRRARRLGLTSPLSSLRRHLPKSTAPKHVKIDDEERQLHDYHLDPLPTPFTRTMNLLFLILLSILVLVFLILYTIYKPPNFIIRWFQWKYPTVLFHVPLPASQRVIALTLDDAPSDETDKILDVLKTYNAKATFFVIGSHIPHNEALLKRIHDEGHEIGNHMWNDEPTINVPLEDLRPQIAKVENLLLANKDGAKYFRPGSGWFSARMVGIVRSLGYKVVLGSVFPFDPEIPYPRINKWHVLSMVRPGAIVILHENRPWSVEQLELILKGLTEKGWKVESVGGLLQAAKEP